MTAQLTRRRFITVSAAAAGSTLLPGAPSARLRPVRWQGIAMGAAASLDLVHPDRAVAEAAITDAVAEVRRLEAVFSLYQDDSALVRLNRTGALDRPPLDLVRCLSDAGHYAQLTGGAFDPTVQPLWTLYSRHFAAPDADPAGPPKTDLAEAVALVDYRQMTITPSRIVFAKPGMAVTLNGIAQGYITDRVTELLRQRGFADILVNMGEIRGSGRKDDGAPWTAGIRKDGGLRRVALKDKAIATSAGSGTPFDRTGRFHHLFDPRSGASAARWSSFSVVAATATEADALSTGFSALDETTVTRIAASLAVGVHAIDVKGRTVVDTV
jgi:thiamine biosynthesis lipoprotein